MTPDQLRLDETRAWLKRARSDLQAARLLVAGGQYAESVFHCQQSAEKALKGFLTFYQKPFRKTHVLGELSPDCVAIDGSLQAVLSQIDPLSGYAWRFRYPGASLEPDASEAAAALLLAEMAVGEIERRLE